LKIDYIILFKYDFFNFGRQQKTLHTVSEVFVGRLYLYYCKCIEVCYISAL